MAAYGNVITECHPCYRGLSIYPQYSFFNVQSHHLLSGIASSWQLAGRPSKVQIDDDDTRCRLNRASSHGEGHSKKRSRTAYTPPGVPRMFKRSTIDRPGSTIRRCSTNQNIRHRTENFSLIKYHSSLIEGGAGSKEGPRLAKKQSMSATRLDGDPREAEHRSSLESFSFTVLGIMKSHLGRSDV